MPETFASHPLLDGLAGPSVALRVCVPDAVDGEAWDEGLWPEERAIVAKAVDVRRRHFAAGRLAAHAALGAAGLPRRAIPHDADRAPIFPNGVVGSITHTDGLAAAIVAASSELRGVGIDVEQHAGMREALQRKILTDAERAQLGASAAELGRVVFCIKEAAYKAQYDLSATYLGFFAMEVAFGSDDETFVATFTANADPFVAGDRIHGKFRVRDGLIAAVAEIR